MESNVEICIGVDPDSEEHGIAIYKNQKLIALHKWSTIDILKYLDGLIDAPCTVMFSIENVMANQFVYARNRNGSTANQSKIAMHIGRCQQSQVELMRWLDHRNVLYMLHKPQKGNWADNKAQFEKVTGWTKQSNADARSAAYFGWLEASK